MEKAANAGLFVTFLGYNCRIRFSQYTNNNRTAIMLEIADTGEPMATATVNIPEYRLGPGEVIIKDYSENEGMLNALVEAKIVADTGKRMPTGFVECPVCRLLVQPQEGSQRKANHEQSSRRIAQSKHA